MPEENMQEYYNARAFEYEQIYFRDMPLRRKEIDDEVTRLAELAINKNVIDLACGTGYWTEIIARKAKSVLAVDFSKEMIIKAREKNYHAPVELVHGDMFTAGIDHAYDLVANGFWFSHQPRQDWQEFFDLLKRLVKPDGLIWIIDNNPLAEGSVQESLGLDEHGNNFKQRELDDGAKYVILKNYFDKSELTQIFSEQFEIDSFTYGEYYWSFVLKLLT